MERAHYPQSNSKASSMLQILLKIIRCSWTFPVVYHICLVQKSIQHTVSSKAIQVPRLRSGHLGRPIFRTWISVSFPESVMSWVSQKLLTPKNVTKIHSQLHTVNTQTDNWLYHTTRPLSTLHVWSNDVAKHTRMKVQDSSALSVSVWQNTYTTGVIDMFHRVGRYVTNHIRIAGSECVVVDQQLVSTVVIKFTSTQKSQQKGVIGTRLQTWKVIASSLITEGAAQSILIMLYFKYGIKDRVYKVSNLSVWIVMNISQRRHNIKHEYWYWL